MQQKSKEWFEARKNRLTGSNVGAALGVNPWKTPDDLIREMVRSYHGAESEFKGNPATEYGTFHEDGATQDYQMLTGNTVEDCGFYVHPEFDWLGASPDGFVGDNGLIEIKCPYGQRDKKPPAFKTAKEQPHYYAQMQVEMACTGRDWLDFYQWAPHGEKLERVEWDQEWWDENLPKLKAFYDRYLSERDNPEHLEEKRIELNTLTASQLVEEYEELTEAVERANARKKEIIDKLEIMTKGRNAEIFGRKFTKVERAGSVSYAKVIKKHCPDVDLEPFRGRPSSFWRLV